MSRDSNEGGRRERHLMKVAGYVDADEHRDRLREFVHQDYPRKLRARCAKWLIELAAKHGGMVVMLKAPTRNGWLLVSALGETGGRRSQAQLGCLSCQRPRPNPGLVVMPHDDWGLRVLDGPLKLASQTHVMLLCPACDAVAVEHGVTGGKLNDDG